MRKLILICVTVTLLLGGCAMVGPAVQGVTTVGANDGCYLMGNVQARVPGATLSVADDKIIIMNSLKREVKELGGNALIVEWLEDTGGQGIALHCPSL